MSFGAEDYIHPDRVRTAYPAAWPQYPYGEVPPTHEESKPLYSIFPDVDHRVAMRDGVRLAVDVYRPRAPGQKFPALIAWSGYGRKLQMTELPLGQNEAGITEFWVPRGYAHVICDARGTYDSEGALDYRGEVEQQDVVEIIEWAASQPWCDGTVGMTGCSYFGVIQLMAASRQPEPLKAIFPYDAVTDLYRMNYHGGIFNFGGRVGWYANVANLMLSSERVKDPSGIRKLFHSGLLQENPFDGDYYEERSPRNQLHKIRIPAYFGSDWTFWHVHLPGVFLGWEGVGDIPRRMLVSPRPRPWRPFAAFHGEALRWYDHWLKGMDTGVMEGPPIRLWVQGENYWRAENEWPLARAEFRKFYLGGPLGGGAGAISDSPGGGGERSYKVEPYSQDWIRGNPRLVYRSEPVTSPLEITGPLSLHLVARSTAEDTDWVVTFQDEAPDGSARLLSRALLRSSHREVDEAKSKPGRPWHPHTRAVPLTPGKEESFEIELCPTCNVFQPSHRLRMEIASCMSREQLGIYHETLHLPAENTVLEGKEGTYLLASVVPR